MQLPVVSRQLPVNGIKLAVSSVLLRQGSVWPSHWRAQGVPATAHGLLLTPITELNDIELSVRRHPYWLLLYQLKRPDALIVGSVSGCTKDQIRTCAGLGG